MPDRKRRKQPLRAISVPIEDYGIIGNAHTAALVSRGGSIDWLCLPRFDSESVFGALLGNPGHGRWLIAPEDPAAHSTRQYCGDTGILQTSFETAEGRVTIIDFMPLVDGDQQVDVIRLVRGDRGCVRMHTEIILRFDYGRAIPWVRQHLGGPGAMAGPNAVQFTTPVALKGTPELTTVGEFTVSAGETVPFTMSWYPSHHKGFRSRDPQDALRHRGVRGHGRRRCRPCPFCARSHQAAHGKAHHQRIGAPDSVLVQLSGTVHVPPGGLGSRLHDRQGALRSSCRGGRVAARLLRGPL